MPRALQEQSLRAKLVAEKVEAMKEFVGKNSGSNGVVEEQKTAALLLKIKQAPGGRR